MGVGNGCGVMMRRVHQGTQGVMVGARREIGDQWRLQVSWVKLGRCVLAILTDRRFNSLNLHFTNGRVSDSARAFDS